ncbi:helix-turn-helix domain-containing protein [Caballeronia sp. RCC_10]|uniref:helix-turn-helix domain-containing protein n=1 Tax=Caballeronia sp. RCC_10 TaxID=3239227 RepID=UPI0035250A4F
MKLRLESVQFATQQGANRRALCCQYGISANPGYKWIRRFEQGDTALADKSRRLPAVRRARRPSSDSLPGAPLIAFQRAVKAPKVGSASNPWDARQWRHAS